MKKLSIVVSILTLIACKEAPKVDYAIVSGKIANKGKGDISIMSLDRSFEKTLDISKEGNFVDTLQIKESSYVLYDGKNPIFLHLEPGYNLNITYNTKDFDKSISISGKGSETSNYLIAKRRNQRELFGNAKDTYSLNETNFKEKIRKIKTTLDSLLENSRNIPKGFAAKENRNINYFYLKLLTDYEDAHKHFSKNDDYKVSDDFLNELKTIDYQNEDDYKFSNYYRSLLNDHYKNKLRKVSKNDFKNSDKIYFRILDSIENKTVRNGLLFAYATSNMSRSKDIETFYNTFINSSTNEKHKNFITEKYNKLTAISKGKPSPKFVDYKNYDGSTTSLEDLKGKYVYIDVWATWCAPCIAEIPALKALEKQFHNKNIEFVSISIDKATDQEKWKSMVHEKELGGIQLFANNDWKSGFIKDYQINGIPRFILIDPAGNIVNPDAPRPSNPALKDMFSELNI